MKNLVCKFIIVSIFLGNISILSFAQDKIFDHSLYGKVLSFYVRDGKVDYRNLKKNPEQLLSYLELAKDLTPEDAGNMTAKERMAFYLNVYNAFTLKVIIDNYPIKSIKKIPGVWDKVKFKVAGKEVSLSYIEHGILRKEFKDPRVHFALVCASIGCPELRDEPFHGKEVDKMLEQEALKLINDKQKLRLNNEKNTVYLSPIFKWYKEDFGDVLKFIYKYVPDKDKSFLLKDKIKIKYLRYDWSLNE